ncbi:MAG: alkyl sulfatase dimerization domain-containing protein [Crocosphaera sp.]|nr:alkyl sulfatase dimerization domain-containing protein [Crocosphaera sp.]
MMFQSTEKLYLKIGKTLLIGIVCLCVMIGLRVDAIALEMSTKSSDIRSRFLIPTEATQSTIDANQEVKDELPFRDIKDFFNAERGFLGTLEPVPEGHPCINPRHPKIKAGKLLIIDNEVDCNVAWDLDQYSFLEGAAPDTVNPSLWRNAKLNMRHGLFHVTDRIYQVRGFDLSVMSLIKGNSGWIIVDPLTSVETAQAALQLANDTLKDELGEGDDIPVKAVIYTHSHVDHYGGVKGVTSEDAVNSGEVEIYAPDGFLEEAVSENIMAGNVMSRRASYMYGNLLPKSSIAQVDGGLGKTTSSGTVSLIAPTHIITSDDEDARPDGLIEKEIDGLTFLFQNVPGSEAPAEMMFFIPELNAFCAAEDATHTLHNLYTLRGAKVRDALAWVGYLNDTLEYMDTLEWNGGQVDVDVVFASHHWPTWGKEHIIDYLEKQRDLYKYIHDQTLRLANQGYNMVEIGEMLELPPSLAQEWYNRGYYGSVNHDSKAVYQRYLGWFDGNPANLYPLPPEEEATRYVEFMGGADNIIAQAQQYYDNGDYRWVAKVMSHVVFAQPDNREARKLEAKALQQLGYQAESGPWRNFFLTGKQELLIGVLDNLPTPTTATSDVVQAMTPEMFFDFMALSLNGPDANDEEYTFNVDFSLDGDAFPNYRLEVKHSVLNYFDDQEAQEATPTIHLSKKGLSDLLWENIPLSDVIDAHDIIIDQGQDNFEEFLALLDKFEFWFNIVLP